MSISHYTHTTQFLSDVTSTALDQLRGHDAAALTELQSLLATLKIRVSHEGTELTSAQMNKVLAFLLPPDAKLANGGYASQLQNGLNGVKKTLTEYANAHPHTAWPLSDFLALNHFGLTADRLDDDVIDVYVGVLEKQDAKRLKLRATVLINVFNAPTRLPRPINTKLFHQACERIRTLILNQFS